MKYHILCYLDDDIGRDVEIVFPVVYYAEKYLNCEVEFAFVWDIHAIYRKQPDLVLLPNTIGSLWYFLISKYAHQQGIKVFAMISEGNFRTNGTFNYWGYNKDKVFYQDFICLWSERTRQFLLEELPEYEGRMVFTGATGFDRYKIYRFLDRREFFKKYDLKDYHRVIGYAGWAFGKLFNEQMRQEIRYLHKDNPSRLQWMEEQMQLVSGILEKTVKNNPDTLFILKRHPNEVHPHLIREDRNEMVGLKNYPNVIYLVNEENIHDLINISDIWMGFETTTALEAWLLDKPTILINPDPGFKRDKLHKGSVIAQNYRQLSNYFDEYYSTGTIKDFNADDKQKNREKLIYETIGFGDGLNHIRTGIYLKKTLDSIDRGKKKRRLSFRFLKMYILMETGKYFYNRNLFSRLPFFKKTIWIFDRRKLKNMENLKKRYYTFMDEFYKKNKLGERIHVQDYISSLFRKQ